jgi:PAS domain S-box-containing protein
MSLNTVGEEMIASGKASKDYNVRINNLMEALLRYTVMDFAEKATISPVGDELDAISLGLNTMAEELEASKIQEENNYRVLKESEERFRMLVENVKDYAIFMINADGYVKSWNKGAAFMKGYAANEIIGKHISVFYTDEENERGDAKENLRKAKEFGRYESEAWRKRKDGSTFFADVILTPVYDDSGILKGFSKITRDITERKKYEEKVLKLNHDLEFNLSQLEAVNKELEAFSYSVSHDLRTPLRAIHSYTQILATEHVSQLNEEAQEMMKSVMSNAKRMGELIDDLLSFSRIGRKELQKTDIDMHALCEIVIYEIKSMGAPFKGSIKLNDLQHAWGDYSLIKQIFINLLSNAIKYTSKTTHPEIEISSFVKDRDLIFAVKDNGAGFDMKYYNKMFGVFQRLHDAQEFEGNGVGLALVKRIVNKHGGHIWAEGKVGKGATFYFQLPIQEPIQK